MKSKKKTKAKETVKKKKIVKKSVSKKPAAKLKPSLKKTAVKKSKPAPKKSAPKKNTPVTKKTTEQKKPVAKRIKIKRQPKEQLQPKPVKRILTSKSKLRYTAKELEFFKKILIEERNSILASAKANMKSLVDSESGEYVGDNSTYATHMAEQGTDEMEREKNYLFVQRDEKYLGYIQEALNRIDLGTYGVCIDCLDEPKLLCNTCPLIPKQRLEFVPITQHCLECKKLRG